MQALPIMPVNYHKIDNYLSRSAQPSQNNIEWLKENGVKNIINFRTMYAPDIDFNEEQFVKESGINYHRIPSVSRHPSDKNVMNFIDLIKMIKERGEKVHIHCKQGADRTGMYSYIYERLFLGETIKRARMELLDHGWHFSLYPDLAEWAENIIKNIKV